ncbi:YCF48-related protein, partial [Candidatus Uhrbacteria bacterium]|nr:YCF48-related protein [Candidatus Uhrbacteria bacterium]
VGSSSRDEVIWKTDDGGVTLTEVLAGTNPGTASFQWNGVDFCKTNRNVGVVVGDDNFIRYTTDGGVNWPLAVENIATATLDLEDVVMIDAATAFAVGDGGILVKTTDGGANWAVQAVPWGTVNLLSIDYSTPNRLWVSGADQLLYYSADGGATWTNANVTVIAGTEDVMAVDFQGTAGILWAGCHYSKVASRTDAAPTDADAPKLPFALNQNYPNPFNPSTRIDFAVDVDGRVTLNVYDVSGRLVATVMDENLKAGSYNVMFNADRLATGVYFYKLSTNAGDITRKMVVVR